MPRWAHALPLIFLALAIDGLPVQAGDSGAGGQRLDLHLVPLRDGLRETSPKRDLARVGETRVGRLAKAAAVDLLATDDALVAHRFDGKRLFYVFYKKAGPVQGPVPYIVQRIKKTERTWEREDDPEPELRVTWQVEVFKTFAGAQRKADQHFGSFHLGEAWRREIIKEYEIGFARVPSVLGGDQWPYAASSSFQYLQRYQTDIGLWDDVVWRGAHLRWRLDVQFDAAGGHRIHADALGIDLPKQSPKAEQARPTVLPTLPAEVLVPGRGLGGLRIGYSDREAVETVLGKPYLDVRAGSKGNRNLSFASGLTINLDAQGRLNTVITHPGFRGQTDGGIRHGMSREALRKRLGDALPGAASDPLLRLPGLVLTFDALGHVRRMVIHRDANKDKESDR